MSRPCWQVIYKQPQDVTRFGPVFWREDEAQAHAAELRRIHPAIAVQVVTTWSEEFAGGD